MLDSRIDVLLATYNGAKFLRQQIDSLLNQTYPINQILIGDDASTDETIEIIKNYRKSHPNLISYYPASKNMGCLNNFSRLLEFSEAEYMAFCDQDDIWHADKIEISMGQLKAMEEKWGNEIPLLVFTDMEIIDDQDKIIATSQWKSMGFNPKSCTNLNHLLVHNIAWGCTIILNRACAYLVTPIPKDSFTHDYWCVLAACSFGHIDFVPQATMKYRLHSENLIGSFQANFCWFIKTLFSENGRKSVETIILKGMVRTFAFFRLYKGRLSEEQTETFTTFINLKFQPKWKELYLRLRYGFLPQGFCRKLLFLIVTLFMKKIDPKYHLK